MTTLWLVKPDSRHGPSIMLQIGELGQLCSLFVEALARYLYTAMQSFSLLRQSLGPLAVRSQAIGIGVIWLSSLSVNQSCEYLPLMVMVNVSPLAWKFPTSLGRPAEVSSAQTLFGFWPFWLTIMFIQNLTSLASIGSPLDHFKPGFSRIVTFWPE